MTKKAISYISYKDNKWPLRISWYALREFQKDTGRKIEELGNDMADMESLLWFSLIAGHTALEMPMTLKREDMQWILDESMEEFNQILTDSFPLPVDQPSSTKKKKP